MGADCSRADPCSRTSQQRRHAAVMRAPSSRATGSFLVTHEEGPEHPGDDADHDGPRMAERKPSSNRPAPKSCSESQLASTSTIPPMTNQKSPSVGTVIGKVVRVRIGRTTRLTSASMVAATARPFYSSPTMTMPGTKRGNRDGNDADD